MARQDNRARGLVAKRRGQWFENFFSLWCRRSGITLIRIEDGCRQVHANKIVRTKQPFDFILGFGKELAFVDTKILEEDSFSFSRLKEHQVANLRLLSEHGGLGYYVILFRNLGRLCAFNAQTLASLEPRKSLSPENCDIDLGTIDDFQPKRLFPLSVQVTDLNTVIIRQ